MINYCHVNKGTDTIEAIVIKTPSKLLISKKALKHMDMLRMLLLVYDPDSSENEDVVSESEDADNKDEPANNEDDVGISFHDDTFKYLSNNLSCFVWDGYCGKSMPPNFEPKGLVHLELSCSSLLHLWNGRKNLTCLRRLDLRHGRRLIETPDFRGMPNLEYLDLNNCWALREVHPSLGLYCAKLNWLNLSGCERLIETPDFRGMPNLEYLDLSHCSALEEVHPSLGLYCTKLIRLNLRWCGSLIETPDFTGMPNLEYLDLKECCNLEEVDPSLGICTKLIRLDLYECKRLKSFPCVNVKSLEYLRLSGCSSLEKFPEIIGSMKSELKIYMYCCGIRELPSSTFQYPTPHITNLDSSGLQNIVTLPNGICKLKSLVTLNLSDCSKLESLPEDIGDLENLEVLCADNTLISLPPSSIVRLNKLKTLSFRRPYFERHFVFPRVNEGLRSLQELNLDFSGLISGGLPEDIGCLSSLKKLCLGRSNCDRLPRSIAQLGALKFLNLSDCNRLRELPELPPNVEELWADYHMDQNIQNYENLKRLVFSKNPCRKHPWAESDDAITDLFAKTLLKCILSLRKAQRVFYMFHPATKIPIWLKYHHNEPQNNLLVKLPENWYANDNFLGFAIFYSGSSYNAAVQLSNDDGSEKLSKKLLVDYNLVNSSGVNFYFIPLASLWDTSKANVNTPNVYGHLKFSLPVACLCNIGFRLLYKDDPELKALYWR